MMVFIADEASPVNTRYRGIHKEIDFPVDMLLTAAPKSPVESRVRQLALACDAVRPKSLFVDSGAFVFMSTYYKHGKKIPVSEMTELVRAHFGACVWLQKQGYPVYAVGEMDLQELYGQHMVDVWRAKYAIPFEDKTGIPVVYCWHASESIDDLIERPWMHYLGISLAYEKKKTTDPDYRAKTDYYDEFASLVKHCYDIGVRVHGYAVTAPRALKRVPFTSVDSVTWQGAIHFGNAMVFTATGDLIRKDVGKRAVKEHGAAGLVDNVMALTRHGSRLKPLDVVGRTTSKGKLRCDARAIFVDQAYQYHKMASWYTEFWKQRGIDWERG